MFRVGIGQDSHRFEKAKALYLGGVFIEGEDGLNGNSDGDVVIHSVCNALASSVGKSSIGTYADEMCLEGGIDDSLEYLKKAFSFVEKRKFKVNNVSVSIEAKKPRLESFIPEMKKVISKMLKITTEDIGITATSGEGLTSFGRGEGIQVITIVSLLSV